MPSRPESEAQPIRQFGWRDMFVSPEEDPRTAGGYAGERNTLTEFLHNYRLTLKLKCAGLDAEAMARRSVEPSDLSLLGLVRHMAGVERFWFRIVMAGQDVPRLHPGGESFTKAVADPAMVAEAWASWQEEVWFAERFMSQAPSLDVSGTTPVRGPIDLRTVLVGMMVEYARHCGHADFLRERIDGRVGQ